MVSKKIKKNKKESDLVGSSSAKMLGEDSGGDLLGVHLITQKDIAEHFGSAENDQVNNCNSSQSNKTPEK